MNLYKDYINNMNKSSEIREICRYTNYSDYSSGAAVSWGVINQKLRESGFESLSAD